MMKSLLIGVMVLFSSVTIAQNVLNSSSPEQIREERATRTKIDPMSGEELSTSETPLPYGYIEDKDVLWSKVIWEVIDMNERLNQPYYRTSDGMISESLSLFDALVAGAASGEIKEVYDDEYFENKMTYEQIMARMERTDTAEYGYEQLNANEEVDPAAIFKFKLDSQDIKMVKVKGMWYIDRRSGELKYRLLGLSILGPDAQTIGTEYDDKTYVDLFWIWYPDARSTLVNYKVFNPLNSSSSITYDDMLNARRFSSVIYKAHTDYGVTPIEDYIPKDSKGQLEESDRIRASILQVEADMWHY